MTMETKWLYGEDKNGDTMHILCDVLHGSIVCSHAAFTRKKATYLGAGAVVSNYHTIHPETWRYIHS